MHYYSFYYNQNKYNSRLDDMNDIFPSQIIKINMSEFIEIGTGCYRKSNIIFVAIKPQGIDIGTINTGRIQGSFSILRNVKLDEKLNELSKELGCDFIRIGSGLYRKDKINYLTYNNGSEPVLISIGFEDPRMFFK